MITIITCSNRQHMIDRVFENYLRQKIEYKELIVVLNKDDMNIHEWRERAKNLENVSIYQLSETDTLGQCLNFAIDKAKYDYISKFDDDDYYSPYYLTQTMEAFDYTNADIVGKATIFIYLEKQKALSIFNQKKENRFVKYVCGATMTVKKEVFEKITFGKQFSGCDMSFQKQCNKYHYKIYSTNKQNYTAIRTDMKQHTWKIDNQKFLNRVIEFTDDFPSIITSKD